MVYYRITITPKSPLSTPWVSGTVWGHIAWAIRYVEGETSLETWMKEQETNPWLFSSQMPEGMLPRPLLPPLERAPNKPSLKEFNKTKKARKAAYIPEALFLSLRGHLNEKTLIEAFKEEKEEGGVKSIPLFHNHIDRQTGHTHESGGLFVETVNWPKENYRFQIFAATETDSFKRFKTLFSFIGDSGFGANASTGKGSFRFQITEEKQLFNFSGNRALSLSHGIITKEMGNPRYKQHTHFGKLGGHFAAGSFSPFKYPILMALPGATFDPCGASSFGKLLSDVHHDASLNTIRHHALHLPIHFREVKP